MILKKRISKAITILSSYYFREIALSIALLNENRAFAIVKKFATAVKENPTVNFQQYKIYYGIYSVYGIYFL